MLQLHDLHVGSDGNNSNGVRKFSNVQQDMKDQEGKAEDQEGKDSPGLGEEQHQEVPVVLWVEWMDKGRILIPTLALASVILSVAGPGQAGPMEWEIAIAISTLLLGGTTRFVYEIEHVGSQSVAAWCRGCSAT
jgi:hypothetical protein